MCARVTATLLLSTGLLSGLLACTSTGEAVPTPTPIPSPPDSPLTGKLDQRITQFCLSPLADVNSDGKPDNNLSLALNTLYSSLEEAVISALDNGSVSPEQAWTIIGGVLERSGLPVSAQIYCETLDESLLSTTLNMLATFSAQPEGLKAIFQSADNTPYGLAATGQVYTDLLGANEPTFVLGPGSFVVPYPQSFFTLPVVQAQLEGHITVDVLREASLSGAVLLESLVQAALTPVPTSIEINGTSIDIPKELLVAQLTAALAEAETSSGEPLCDLEINGKPALSAYYAVAGVSVQLAP